MSSESEEKVTYTISNKLDFKKMLIIHKLIKNEKNFSSNENLIYYYFDYLFKFQYDRAKSCLEKSKETNRIWSLFQNALLNLINGEKFYNNLLFLNLKSITRIGDRYFEPVISLLEQTARELNANRVAQNSPPPDISLSQNAFFEIHQMPELNNQLISFVNFRFDMMTLYFELKEKSIRQERGMIESAIKQLSEAQEKSANQFTHPILAPLKNLYEMEIGILKNLLECHHSIDQKLDCVKSIMSIKEINEVFKNSLPQINSKLSKESKSFSLFSRSGTQSRSIPPLYQWFKIYYQSLLNKFSLVNHDSFQMLGQINYIYTDKIEIYTKLVAFIRKFGPSLTGILLEITSSDSMIMHRSAGFAYELASSFLGTQFTQGADVYPLVFTYPARLGKEAIEKHMKPIIGGYLNNDLDQKVKYFFDQSLKSSYYLARISENYVFFMVFELNKQENRAKTISFVQEISDELSLSNVFSSFNPTLK